MARTKTKPEAPKKETGSPVYSYPTKSRCPRCGSLQTDRLWEYEGVQHRRCRAAICRHKYKIHGVKV